MSKSNKKKKNSKPQQPAAKKVTENTAANPANVYQPVKKKKASTRVFVLVICAVMFLGFICLPLFSIFASAAEGDDTIVISSFEKGELQSAIDEARGDVDFNQIKRLAVSGGTLGSNDYGAICGLPNLEYIELSGCEAENGVFCDNAIQGRNNLTYISLPKNTVEIGRAALANNKRLEKISMPSSVERILDYAFENCEGLTDIVIPTGLKLLSNGAFNGCRSLVSIDLPLGLTAIPDNCFTRCYGLKELHIPPTVGVIGMNAFADCDSLEGIYFYGELAPTPGGGMFPQNGHPTVHAVPDAIGFDSGEWTKVTVEYDVDPDQPYYYAPTEETRAETEAETSADTEKSEDETSAESADTEAAETTEAASSEEETTAAETVSAEKTGGISLTAMIIIIAAAVVATAGISAFVTVKMVKKMTKND